MNVIIEFNESRKKILSLGLIWAVMFIIPWRNYAPILENLYLTFSLDLFRLSIALCIFIVPGILFYLLIEREVNRLSDSWGIIPIGFVFSVMLIEIIGLIGRVAGFSFAVARGIFAFVGAIEFILLWFFSPSALNDRKRVSGFVLSIPDYAPLLLVILFAVLLTFHDELFFIDDRTYLAYVTNWQHSLQLNFKNIILKSDFPELERFWLAMYPMGQSLLSDLSGVPGILLIANYLELFLVPIAVIASYWFGRELGLSRKASILSILIQVVLFSWMIGEEWPVGKWFYESMSEDKVSAVFHLAPVFFAFILRYLAQSGKRNLILIIGSGLALTLTHPVSLFFSCVIASGLGLFSWISGRSSGRIFVILLVVLVVLMLPYVIIRLYDYSSQTAFAVEASSLSKSYQVDRYVNVINDDFYGINPGVLLFFDIPPESRFYRAYQAVRLFPLLVILLAGVLSLFVFRRGPFSWYVSICVLLIVVATIPYTGWILGYFTDARLISRIAWFMPLGLGSVLILSLADEWLKSRRIYSFIKNVVLYRMLKGYFLWFLVGSVFVSPLVVFRTIPHAPLYFNFLDHNVQLAQVGAYIDRNSSDPVTAIAVDYMDTQFLPGVSAHATLISFREEKLDNGHNYYLSPDEIRERIHASNVIRLVERNVSDAERCSLVKKYDIKFVIVPIQDIGLYEFMIGKCDVNLTRAFKTRDLILLALK